LTMCNFLLHFSRYSIALNLIFTAFTFSPIFPTFLSSSSQMEPTPSQVRNHYSQKNQEAHLERALAFRKGANLDWPSNVCLPLCIVLRMTTVPEFIIEVGWWYRSGVHWWRKWTHRSVHLIVWHWRRRFGSPKGSRLSRPGAPGQVVTNYKGSTAKDTEPCRYCYCLPSASKFPKSTWGNGTTTAQMPKLNPPQQIIRVWPCTIHQGAAATQV
jgi:hypothetical protein